MAELFVGVAVTSGLAASDTVRADVLLPASVADQLVPNRFRSLMSRLRRPVRTAVAAERTNLAKALAVERIVHAAVRPTGADCVAYATVMVALGRELGLPFRLTIAGSSPSNYDTHTTASVWLPKYRRWGIVDPTFGGTFERGSNPRPLNAADIRDALIRGWWGQIRWRPSAADSVPLSSYYVNPVFLFRYVGVYAYAKHSVIPLVLPDSGDLDGSRYESSQAAIATTPPNQTLEARIRSGADRLQSGSLALPPAYAPRVIWQGRVTLPTTISVPAGSVVVWVSRQDVRVSGYGTSRVAGGSLSPILASGGFVKIGGSGLSTVRVYAARKFPDSPRA